MSDAFKDGVCAYAKRIARSVCPYADDHANRSKRQDWLEGWAFAQKVGYCIHEFKMSGMME